MKIQIAVAPELLGAACAVAPPFEGIAWRSTVVVKLPPRDSIAQPPSEVVRFVNLRDVIGLEDPGFAVWIEE